MAEQMDAKNILALMSGTSVDTIDAAICRIGLDDDGRYTCEVLEFVEHPMEERLRARVFEVFADGSGSLSLACSLNFELGEAFAAAANAAIESWNGQRSDIAVIASHGQTLYHIAPHMAAQQPDRWVASTLQLGEAAIIAERTGVPVISNFRVADMAVGGNGAPLVPFADYHLFSEPGRGVVVHNLGGIGNCTWLAQSGLPEDVLAFDTGPANMMIDALTAHFYPGESFDRDGKHGRAGRVIPKLLTAWMAMPYISAPPPKSTGRELFGRQFVEEILRENPTAKSDDLIATATEFTAQSLAENLKKFVKPRGSMDRLMVAGGGARNGFLMDRIKATMSGDCTEVISLDALGRSVNSKNRECAGFAVMGYAHLLGQPGNLPSVTGARHPALLGHFTPVP